MAQAALPAPASWLRPARLAWPAFAFFAAAVFLAALPARWAQLTQPPPITAQNLSALGLGLPLYAAYTLSLEVLLTLGFVGLGALLFAQRSADRVALLSAYFLVAFGVGNQTLAPVADALRGRHAALDLLLDGRAYLAWLGFALFFYLFPNGRFAPGWTRWLAAGWALVSLAWNFGGGTRLHPARWPPGWLAAYLGFYWASFLCSQVYRYRRVSTPLERQQTKWVVFGTGAIVAVTLAMLFTILLRPDIMKVEWLLGALPDTPQGQAAWLIWLGAARLAFLGLPAGIAVSILRYRLWDIDRLLNRALVYSALPPCWR